MSKYIYYTPIDISVWLIYFSKDKIKKIFIDWLKSLSLLISSFFF